MKIKKKDFIKKILTPNKYIYPVVPLRNIVFPDMTMPLFIGRSVTLKTIAEKFILR